MPFSDTWNDFLLAARGGRPERVPVALIVDSPWLPGHAGLDTLDFFLDEEAWLRAHLDLHARFPEVVFLPGFWVEYGMANEPSAFGARMMWHRDSPPGLRPLELAPSDWANLPRPDPEKDGLMPLVLRRIERLERGGRLPEPHRMHMVAARGPLAVAAHVLGLLPLLEATLLEPEATHAVLDIFSETVVRFLRAQLDRLREPAGVLVLDDIPGMLSPQAFEEFGAPYLRRVFEAFPGLVRVHHDDTPCLHLARRMGELPCEVWNFSHEMDLATVRQEAPGMGLLGNVAPLGTLARGTPEQVEQEARACIAKAGDRRGFILSAGGGASPGMPAENLDALVRAARS